MAEPTIQEVFGANAVQSVEAVIIRKSDLEAVGLVPAEENTAESLIGSIIAFAQLTLTETNREANVDQSVIIEDQLPANTTRNNQNVRQFIKSVTFEKLDDAVFNPMNY